MAELSQAEKDAISHRGRAARALAARLRDRVPPAGAGPRLGGGRRRRRRRRPAPGSA
jgi:hypothetical protein